MYMPFIEFLLDDIARQANPTAKKQTKILDFSPLPEGGAGWLRYGTGWHTTP